VNEGMTKLLDFVVNGDPEQGLNMNHSFDSKVKTWLDLEL